MKPSLPPMPLVLRALGVTLAGEATQQIRCPVHEDRSPSARYYRDDQRVFCFVCGKGWDALGVVMARLKLDKAQAMVWLESRFIAGAADLRDQVRDALKPDAAMSVQALSTRLDLLDLEVRRRAPDEATAVRWWRGLDLLRTELRDPELRPQVAGRLKKIKGIMHAYPVHA